MQTDAARVHHGCGERQPHSISQFNTSQHNKGINFYNSWFSTQCTLPLLLSCSLSCSLSLSAPFSFPLLVNIEEVYIRNKIHLFLGILWSAFEMWYSTNNDGELLHECIKWDGGPRCAEKKMGLSWRRIHFDLTSRVERGYKQPWCVAAPCLDAYRQHAVCKIHTFVLCNNTSVDLIQSKCNKRCPCLASNVCVCACVNIYAMG